MEYEASFGGESRYGGMIRHNFIDTGERKRSLPCSFFDKFF
jgi:hypothetical protein